MKQLLVLYTLVLSCSIFAQEDRIIERKNTFSLELGGNGLLGSVNYDRIILQRNALKWFGRVGFTEYHGGGDELNFFIIYETGMLLGGPKHHFDLGFVVVDRLNRKELIYTPRVSYRFVGEKGFHCRISPFMWSFSVPEDGFRGYWAGAAFGYSF